MKPKHAIAILTYAPEEKYDCRLQATLKSLYMSGYPGKVFVVDDGSGRQRSTKEWNVYVCQKSENAGIARGKNTSIRLLMEHGVDIGFLADDDVKFGPGWWEDYIEAHETTCGKVQHLSWARRDQKNKQPHFKWCLGCRLAKPNWLNGLLLTFTSKVIETVGGFWATEVKWGWDHVNWTNRIVEAGLTPYYADVADPKVWMGENHQLSPVSKEQRRETHKLGNLPRIGPIYRPLVEWMSE